MTKAKISNILRKLKLIYLTDWMRFYYQKFKNRKINKTFKLKHPNVKLPPDYLIYESFQINYHKYYTQSKDTAQWIINHFEKHIELKNKRILDWGCGPGRIIRHLPELVGEDCEFHGTDYNKKSIDWCAQNLSNITFYNNSLQAQLPYEDNYFDVIYGISIFTHLSEQLHYDWYEELHRILKPNGILFLTTHGDNYKVKLMDSELKSYQKGELVVRGSIKEGHRTYAAFHPEGFMRKLFDNIEILEHIVSKPEKGGWLPQDIWILKKK